MCALSDGCKSGGFTLISLYQSELGREYCVYCVIPPDLHPSDKAHKLFAENIVFNWIDKML